MDYTALHQRVSARDRRRLRRVTPVTLRRARIERTYLWVIGLTLAGVLAAPLVDMLARAAGVEWSRATRTTVDGNIMLAAWTVAAFVVAAVSLQNRREGNRRIRADAFARANGLSYVHHRPLEQREHGLAFSPGSGGAIVDGFFLTGPVEAEVGNVIPTLETAASRAGVFRRRHGYLRISLRREQPHTVFVGRVGRSLVQSAVRRAAGLTVEIAVSGPLDAIFTVHATAAAPAGLRGYCADTLLQSVLATEFARCDIEFVGHALFVYRRGRYDLFDEAFWQAFEALLRAATR